MSKIFHSDVKKLESSHTFPNRNRDICMRDTKIVPLRKSSYKLEELIIFYVVAILFSFKLKHKKHLDNKENQEMYEEITTTWQTLH